jgi:hypothetical protein
MVLLSGLPWPELIKAIGTSVFAALVAYAVGRRVVVAGNRVSDLVSLALISAAWLAAIALGLWLTKSQLPQELRRKKTAPAATDVIAEDNATGMEP